MSPDGVFQPSVLIQRLFFVGKRVHTMASECQTSDRPSAREYAVAHVVSVREYFLQTLATAPLVEGVVARTNGLLRHAGLPEKSLLTNEEFVLSSTAVVATLLAYYILFGKRHRRKRARLADDLRLAQRQVSHRLPRGTSVARDGECDRPRATEVRRRMTSPPRFARRAGLRCGRWPFAESGYVAFDLNEYCSKNEQLQSQLVRMNEKYLI